MPAPTPPDRPFTRMELVAARFANACTDTAAAFTGILIEFAAARQREAAERLVEQQRARQRFERARRWVREHPDQL